MPRTVEITVSQETSEYLLDRVRRIPGVIGLRLSKAVSLDPPGDVVTMEATTPAVHQLMRVVQEMSTRQPIAMTTSENTSIVSQSAAAALANDPNEATWEEMELLLGKESNMSGNSVAVMFASGVLAAVGIATRSIHLIVAAAVIAPGFEPLVRIGLGIVARSDGWKRGLRHTWQGYLALLAGSGAATTALVYWGGLRPFERVAETAPASIPFEFWLQTSLESVIVSFSAATAGAILVATNRSVLTGGVMIALELIPSTSLVGMGLVSGELQTAGQAFGTLAMTAAITVLMSLVVFGWKRLRIHRRDAIM